MVRSIMVQGTTSGAGKTVVTALLCRHFQKKGLRVAPFKAQNLSLNSFVTQGGHEIGISQAFQAWASGIEPDWRMNPILLKPRDKGSCQIVLEGRPYKDVGAGMKGEKEILLESVRRAYLELSHDYDIIVVEGSGSPAEVNLRRSDIANMTTASLTRSPVLMVGDIDKGGVFAGIYGTYHLLEKDYQALVKGFLINRFRGERSILSSGIEFLEGDLGVPCLGVLSYLNLKFPSEDSLSMDGGGEARGGDIRGAWLNNLDALLSTADRELDWNLVEGILDAGI